MTEEIGSDKHKRPSSAEIDVVKLKERYTALATDYAETKEVMRENTRLQISQNDIIIDKLSKIQTALAVGEQRFEKIEDNHKTLSQNTTESLKAITGRVDAVEADKRGPVALILATVSALGTAVAAYFGLGK